MAIKLLNALNLFKQKKPMKNGIAFENTICIDLTHALSPEIPCWDNDCGFQHGLTLDYADCSTDIKFRVQKFEMPAGIGTHMDAPAHCIPGGKTIDEISL